MSGYTFYFQRPDGGVPDFDFGQFADDSAAQREAQTLFASHPTAERIEIFNGERIIGVAYRPVSPPDANARNMTARVVR